MPHEKLTKEQVKERRREAALKGVRTRQSKARINEFLNDVAASVTYQARATEGRKVVERAQSIGRESDLYYTVHLNRWPRKPSEWTPAMIARLTAFLDGFIRPDGTPQPVPHRRRRKHQHV
jgi:hypothetical protein